MSDHVAIWRKIDFILLLILFLPLYLPSRFREIFLFNIGSYSMDVTEVLMLVTGTVYISMILISGKVRKMRSSIFLVLFFCYLVFITALRVIEDPTIFYYALGAFFEFFLVFGIVNVVASYHVLNPILYMHRFMKIFILILLVSTTTQQIIYGFIIKGSIYSGESFIFDRIRTTIGTGTATGHVLFIFFVLLEFQYRINKGKIPIWCHILFIIAIILSASRAAFLMLILYEIFRIIFSREKLLKKTVVSVLLIACTLFMLKITGVEQRFFGRAIGSDTARRYYLSYSLSHWQNGNHFLLGDGFGADFLRMMRKPNYVYSPLIYSPVPSPHNTYVLLLNETGIIGLFLFCFILLLPISYIFRSIHYNKDSISESDKCSIYLVGFGYILYIIIGLNTETLLLNEVRFAIPLVIFYYTVNNIPFSVLQRRSVA